MGDHYCVATSNELPQVIAAIVNQCNYISSDTAVTYNAEGEISW
jgi:hypothetical protein